MRELGLHTFCYGIQCHDDRFFPENLAFGKDTDQSSVGYHGPARLAVDGDSTTHYFKGSCTHTTYTGIAWWRVDLVQVQPVSEVYIVNRGDGWGYRLNNSEILVGRLPFLLYFTESVRNIRGNKS